MNNAIGIDMGTVNLKIYNRTNDEVTNVKNTIAIVDKNKMYAYGDEAYSMYEKAPETIEVSFPIVSGVIADIDNMQSMLFEVLENISKARLKGADVVVAVPTDITEVEKKAFSDILTKAKIKTHSVQLCEKPIADALGMDLDVTQPTGVMVVDIGGDTTELSVISLGGLVISELLPYGGNQIDDSIVTFMKRKFNLLIGRKTAKLLKESIGSAMQGRGESMKIVGRDVVSGLPIEMEMKSDMIYQGMQDDLNSICNAIKMTLEKIPPELAKDIVHSGIYLTGGGSKLHGIAELFDQITNIRINQCEQPDNCTVLGLGKVLSDEKYKRFGYALRSRIFN